MFSILFKIFRSSLTDLNPAEVREVLLHVAMQAAGDAEYILMVLHHEGDELGGQQLVQVHLISGAQNGA